jgi:hypothetical protein
MAAQTWVDLNKFDLSNESVHITYVLGRAARYLRYKDGEGEIILEDKHVQRDRSELGLRLHCRLRVDSAHEVWLDVWLPDIHAAGSSAKFETVALLTTIRGGFMPWFTRQGVLQEYTCLPLEGTAVAVD